MRVTDGRPGFARVESEDIGSRDAVVLADTVRHMLRLDADLSGFYEVALADPELSWAAEGAGRMLRSPTVFEDVVKTIEPRDELAPKRLSARIGRRPMRELRRVQ